MIWLTWRQHRIGMLVLVLMLLGAAAFFINSGLAAYSAYYQVVQGSSVATCIQQHSQNSLCQTLNSNFSLILSASSPRGILSLIPLLLFILPQALVGMFLGAPLVASELEQGTFSLVWTQSVTRLRWLLVKVGALMGVTLLVFASISLLVMWWNGPFERIGSGITPPTFDVEGVVPLAYMAYALSLAIAAGTLLRKTVPAMFAVLVGYLVTRIPIGILARPNYAPPLSVTWDPYLTTPKVLPGGQDWSIFQGLVDHAGHPIPDDNNQTYKACGANGTPSAPHGQGTTIWNGYDTACTHAHGWLATVSWQPADRFWLFQGIESAIFFALAAGLLALAFWWVSARMS